MTYGIQFRLKHCTKWHIATDIGGTGLPMRYATRRAALLATAKLSADDTADVRYRTCETA